MPNSVRVVCCPVVTQLDGLAPFVEVASLRLARHGGSPTLVTETPQVAKLQFALAYLSSVRDAAPQHEPYASLKGSIRIAGEDERPCFALSADGFEYEGDDPAELGLALRSIAFSFEATDFPEAPSHTDARARLLLRPPENKGVRLAELSITLLVNDQEEAGPHQNDTLDVCLGPQPMRILLRFPQDREAPESTFVLGRAADGFEQVRSHRDDLIPGNDTLDLLFDSVVPGQRHSLTVRTQQGRQRVLFDKVLELER